MKKVEHVLLVQQYFLVLLKSLDHPRCSSVDKRLHPLLELLVLARWDHLRLE